MLDFQSCDSEATRTLDLLLRRKDCTLPISLIPLLLYSLFILVACSLHTLFEVNTNYICYLWFIFVTANFFRLFFVIFVVVYIKYIMEFPITDKQIKMWCFYYADECELIGSRIDGVDRIEKAERIYDFICSYQPPSPSGAQTKPRASLLSRLKNFLRLKGRG